MRTPRPARRRHRGQAFRGAGSSVGRDRTATSTAHYRMVLGLRRRAYCRVPVGVIPRPTQGSGIGVGMRGRRPGGCHSPSPRPTQKPTDFPDLHGSRHPATTPAALVSPASGRWPKTRKYRRRRSSRDPTDCTMSRRIAWISASCASRSTRGVPPRSAASLHVERGATGR